MVTNWKFEFIGEGGGNIMKFAFGNIFHNLDVSYLDTNKETFVEVMGDL